MARRSDILVIGHARADILNAREDRQMNDEEKFRSDIDDVIETVDRWLAWIAVAVVIYVAVMIGAAVWVQA